MNVQDFVEKVVRGAKDGARAAMDGEAPQVRVVLDLQMRPVNEQVDVYEDEILPKAHIEVDFWRMMEEPMGTAQGLPATECETDAIDAEEGLRMKPRSLGASLSVAAARLTARETDAQGKAKLRALEVCTSIWPVTPEDSAAVNRLLYRHERALRGLPDITDELAMEHLGLDAPKPEEKADEAERFCEALKEIRRATIPVFSYPGREGMNMDWLREVCHAALVGRPFQAPAQARVAYLRPKGRITEVSTDEDLLQRLPAMFRKANGEPPTDADCARLVALLRKPRSKP